MSVSLGFIVEALGGRLIGDPSLSIQGLAPLSTAGEADFAFLAHARYAYQLQSTRAAAVAVAPAFLEQAAARGACVVTDDPYVYFARLTQWWRLRHQPVRTPSIHPSACIDASASLGRDVEVGPLVVIAAGARIADGVRIGAHTFVGEAAQIGTATHLYPRVTVGERCSIGERCILHPGVVIGADGFGFAPWQGQWLKIEQLGSVRIGNDVEIGANTCIDRGALDDTVIEDGVKLDNLIQIGHNVRIGAHTAMAGNAGVAGSATIGAHCTVGGGATVLGHLSVADRVHISAASVVTRSITKPGHYSGIFPIDDNANWEKNAASLKQLNRLRERLKALEHTIASAQQNKTAP